MHARLLIGTLAVFMMSLAGCVGNFEVKQTEPFRVQIDGDAQETRVAAKDSNDRDSNDDIDEPEKSEFKIENAENVQVVKVTVEVMNVEIEDDDDGDDGTTTTSPSPTDEASEPAIIVVIIEDRDTQEKLAEERVEARDQMAQVELDVDVKGRDNVVIITQAVQGVADVSVAAESEVTTGGGATTAPPATTYG